VQIGINSQNSFGQCWWISRKLRLFHNFCVQDPPASSKKGDIHQVSSWGRYANGQKCDQNHKVDNHNLICINAIFSVEVSLMRFIEGMVQQFGVVTKCCVSQSTKQCTDQSVSDWKNVETGMKFCILVEGSLVHYYYLWIRTRHLCLTY
jgi:hypothetical protein